jgi:hypothetical protein
MKIDIYATLNNKRHYQVVFNDLEFVMIESIDELHKMAYKWLNKNAPVWKPDEATRKTIHERYSLVATFYLTSIKEIPSILENYPELLL